MLSHFCTNRGWVQFMPHSFPYSTSYYRLKSVLTTQCPALLKQSLLWLALIYSWKHGLLGSVTFPRSSPIWWQPRQTVIFPPLVLPFKPHQPKDRRTWKHGRATGPRKKREVKDTAIRQCLSLRPQGPSKAHKTRGGIRQIQDVYKKKKSLNRKSLLQIDHYPISFTPQISKH